MNSISFKIFISIFLIGIVFLNIVIGVQIFMTDTLYEQNQVKTMTEDLEKIESAYDRLSDEELVNYVAELKASSNLEVAFIDAQGTALRNDIFPQSNNKYFNEGKKWFLDTVDLKEGLVFQSSVYKAPQNGQSYPFVIHTLKATGKTQHFILAMDQLVMTRALTKTIQEFYVILYTVMMGIMAVVAYVFSRQVSNRLILMEAQAKHMAVNLDFTKEILVESDDELGSLASSLNALSHALDESLRALERKNIETKEFMADVSHELKTPLTIVSGYVEGIKDGLYINDVNKYMSLIGNEVNRMSTLVSDLLALVKLEQTSFDMTYSEFELEPLMNECVERFDSQLSALGVDLLLNVSDSHIKVRADRQEIGRVVENLLSNAIRYSTDQGMIHIEVVAMEAEVKVSIVNSCEPLTDEEMSRLWDRFYRVDKSRNKSKGGTGLGLTIVANILKKHESSYGVERTETGLRFSFDLRKVD